MPCELFYDTSHLLKHPLMKEDLDFWKALYFLLIASLLKILNELRPCFFMSLCMLVYNLGQRQLRKTLKRIKTGIKNKLGKLTMTPTLRWVFQCFQGIHLWTLDGVNQIVNLTSSGHFILSCLPSSCRKYYLLS